MFDVIANEFDHKNFMIKRKLSQARKIFLNDLLNNERRKKKQLNMNISQAEENYRLFFTS
jgi:hypothetical protein